MHICFTTINLHLAVNEKSTGPLRVLAAQTPYSHLMLTQQSPGLSGMMFIIEAKSLGKLTKFLFAGPKSIALTLDEVICPPGQSVG